MTSSSVMNFFKKSKEPSTSQIDPLNPEVFPEEIRQEILGYLPVSDLINATHVSKLWNETIGESDAFKKRVCIKVHLWTKDIPSSIKKSSRHYENIALSDFDLDIATLKCFFKKHWRNVTLSIGKVSSQGSFLELMECFKTVRTLKIMSTNIRKLNTDNRLVLDELESLTLSDVTLDLFDVLIAQQPSLKSLSLRFIITDIASPKTVGQAIVEFLKLNQNVRDLETNFIVTNDLFKLDLAQELKLELKTFVLGLNETEPVAQSHIEEFLKTQARSLENFKLIFHQKLNRNSREMYGWDHRHDRYGYEYDEDAVESSDDVLILFNVWNFMSSLKTLSLRFLRHSEELELHRNLEGKRFFRNLKPNMTVKSISIQFMNVNIPEPIIIEVLKLSPNLKKLYVSKLTSSLVKFCALHLKALRELNCFEFEGACKEIYVELKNVESDVNNFIVISDRCAFG